MEVVERNVHAIQFYSVIQRAAYTEETTRVNFDIRIDSENGFWLVNNLGSHKAYDPGHLFSMYYNILFLSVMVERFVNLFSSDVR